MILLAAVHMESVACVRYEAPAGSGKYVGCGKGWVRPRPIIAGPCSCGRAVIVTGQFKTASLRDNERKIEI